jgi:hypothetical protein
MCIQSREETGFHVQGIFEAFHISPAEPGPCSLLILAMCTRERHTELIAAVIYFLPFFIIIFLFSTGLIHSGRSNLKSLTYILC